MQNARTGTSGERGVPAWISFLRDYPLGAIGFVILCLLIATAIFAPWIAPYGAKSTDFAAYTAPNAEHWFGTDHLGRDIFSRVVWGTRLSLYVGLSSVGIGITLGAIWGIYSGYVGGIIDVVTQRIVDILMGFPPIILALGLMAALGQSVNNVILALVIILSPSAARTMRSQVLSLRELAYVEAARALGASTPRIVFQHLVPNSLGTYIVLFTVNVAYAIVVEASLSFLGLGSPPDEPSWGGMLTSATDSLVRAPWIALYPGLAICLTVFALNLFGDAIRDLTDRKMQ